ncbi:hypothetical protein [Mycobacterium sp. MMS18-G62]
MAEREASGDFDYQLDDPGEADGLTSLDAPPEGEESGNFDYLFRDADDEPWEDPLGEDTEDPDGAGYFDAFNEGTWSFQPAPTPWYRTKQAVTVIIAATAATAAIVISGVLLLFRGPSNAVDETTSVTPTAPTSAAPTQLATSAPEPPPLPPPPPSETAASPENPAPVYNSPRVEQRPTKAPEINVTRAPMSVAPQTRTPPGQRH